MPGKVLAAPQLASFTQTTKLDLTFQYVYDDEKLVVVSTVTEEPVIDLGNRGELTLVYAPHEIDMRDILKKVA
jgi:hypothetical protein